MFLLETCQSCGWMTFQLPRVTVTGHWCEMFLVGSLPTLVRRCRRSTAVVCCRSASGRTLSLCILCQAQESSLHSDRYDILTRCPKFLGRRFQKLEHKQDRQTDRCNRTHYHSWICELENALWLTVITLIPRQVSAVSKLYFSCWIRLNRHFPWLPGLAGSVQLPFPGITRLTFRLSSSLLLIFLSSVVKVRLPSIMCVYVLTYSRWMGAKAALLLLRWAVTDAWLMMTIHRVGDSQLCFVSPLRR